jgi:hypothetical protein
VVNGGVLADQCGALLSTFFAARRRSNNSAGERFSDEGIRGR